jgi:phosphoribosyl-dephospho-CoA transferase
MLLRHPAIADAPLVGDWARRAWPVIVRRRMDGDLVDGVPAALPLPPCYGKRRIGFCFSSSAGVSAMPPVLLRDAASAAPPAWRATLASLLDLGESVSAPPRVFGALLWEHATGLPYLSPQSDLDLIWSVADARSAAGLVAGLRRLDAGSPVRLDGELELPDGGAVNWREFSQVADAASDTMLIKTMDGVEVRNMAALFGPPALLS